MKTTMKKSEALNELINEYFFGFGIWGGGEENIGIVGQIIYFYFFTTKKRQSQVSLIRSYKVKLNMTE